LKSSSRSASRFRCTAARCKREEGREGRRQGGREETVM
jgi:hypothetical protein